MAWRCLPLPARARRLTDYAAADPRYPERSIAGVQFAPRTLVAFGRVRLSAGARKTVTLHVPLRRLQYWSVAAGDWATASGRRTVSVGASSRDLRLAQAID